MKCLVTGGAGFIGSNLVEELVLLKNQVIVIDNLATGNLKNLDKFRHRITFYNQSILNLQKLKKISSGVEIVFHLAAIPSVKRSLIDPKTTSEANIEGTLNVLLSARDNKVKKVIIASSSSVYGDTKILPKEETMVPQPKSFYALSKLVDENYCQLFSRFYGLNTVCLRYFNVYGPRQNPNSNYAAVIPLFIKAVLNGERPTIYGDGKQTRDFTYVKDVVRANLMAVSSKVNDGMPINVAGGKNISINGLLELVNKIIGKNIEAIFEKPQRGDVHDSLADISRAKKFLGYNPSYNLLIGLKETIGWMKKGFKK